LTPPPAALVSVQGVSGLARLALVVVFCAGLAASINRWGRLGHGRDDVSGSLRASLQLGLVGLLIAGRAEIVVADPGVHHPDAVGGLASRQEGG
jgi:hypothetical protein